MQSKVFKITFISRNVPGIQKCSVTFRFEIQNDGQFKPLNDLLG